VPAPARGGGTGAAGTDASNRSLGRFPDGFDADRLCTDFLLQAVTTMPVPSAAGAANIKVANAGDFAAGQTIAIDSGDNRETAAIAAVGTAGAATIGTAITAGATQITVSTTAGFVVGQAIEVDSGANRESAVIAATAGGGRGGAASITLAAPLTRAHAAGAQVSGTGLTLASALSRAHAAGAQIAGGVPTPGAPNQYARRR
jgi:hypothetical protein